MQHLDFSPTPISKLDYYSRKLECNILCKRDDLFAEAGGGSKARMLQYILAEVNPSNCDVLVTAGGPCSNFNRACALMCAKLGVPMHLVEYTDMPEEFDSSLNYYLCNLAGIRKTRCKKTDVPSTIKQVLDSYQGKKVKLVYGGGKSLEGIYAYYDAVAELSKQIESIDHLSILNVTNVYGVNFSTSVKQTLIYIDHLTNKKTPVESTKLYWGIFICDHVLTTLSKSHGRKFRQLLKSEPSDT